MIRFFAAHPTAANLLMIALVAIGLLSIGSLRRETMPDFSVAQVQVAVPYPGASAEDVEQAICARIEDAVDGIDGVEEIVSEAKEGAGIVTIQMDEGREMATFLAEVKREVDAITDFPELAEAPTVQELGWVDLVVSISVAGQGVAERDLKTYCEELKERIRLETGVRLIQIQGFSDHQLRIELSAAALRRHRLSARDVADIVASQSIDVPAGTVTTTEREVLLRFTDERRSPRELAELVIVSNATGGEVRLGELGRIRDVFELAEHKILLDGERAALLNIQKTKSEDALDVLAQIEGFLERELQRKPPGIRLALTQNVASIVEDRLDMLLKNAWQGMLLVFVVLALFFGLRFGFWVAMGIPVSFLGAFYFLQLTGHSINMITMVGLLLALGLLMDDAIVLAENIAAHRQRGKGVLASAVDGVNEVRVGVLSSFATTTCVFGPLAFLEGDIGKVLRVMPIVLILVLAVSLIEAFLILPNHLTHSMQRFQPEHRGRFRARFEDGLEWVRERVLGRVVDLSVRWRLLTLGLVGLVFLISVGLLVGGVLKFEAFPDVDGDVIEARILQPQGTPLTRTEAVVQRVTAALTVVDEELTPLQPDGQSLVQSTLVMFGENPDAFESGPHVARVVVDLLTAEMRNARVADILEGWRREIGEVPGVLALKFTEPAYGPAGRPIEIRLSGPDLTELKRASVELMDWLNGFAGVLDLSDDLRPGKPEIRLRLREGAHGLGLTSQGLASQIRTAFFGATAREIQIGKEPYEVDVRVAEEDRNRLTDVDGFFVTLSNGDKVPLPAVATFESGRGFARIARVDGRRTVTITGEVDTLRLNTAELMGRLRSDYLPLFDQRFPDVDLSLEGEAKESQKTAASLQRAVLIGILGIFLLLSFEFRSYVEPLIVMIAIPLCLIGVIWGHLLMGFSMTMPSIFGFVSLTGVVINDSILLVEFIKLRRREGLAAVEAARRAGRERFRAVLLTSLTTIFGLLPLLFERSLQAQFLTPLAAAIVFGMISSTVLVLIVLPALYGVLDDLGWTVAIEEADAG